MHHKTCYKSGGTLGIDPAANYDEQLALYQAGAVDVLWTFMGIPSPAMQAARARRPLKALALPPELRATSTPRDCCLQW
jgi:TRAP-type uncharacterized transport system substrate-binding protein